MSRGLFDGPRSVIRAGLRLVMKFASLGSADSPEQEQVPMIVRVKHGNREPYRRRLDESDSCTMTSFGDLRHALTLG